MNERHSEAKFHFLSKKNKTTDILPTSDVYIHRKKILTEQGVKVRQRDLMMIKKKPLRQKA